MPKLNCTFATLLSGLTLAGLLAGCGGGGADVSMAADASHRAVALALTKTVLAVKPRAFEHSIDHQALRAVLMSAGIEASEGTCFKPNTDGTNLIGGCLQADVLAPIQSQASYCSPWLDAFGVPEASAAAAKALGFQIVDLGPSWKEVPCPSMNR